MTRIKNMIYKLIKPVHIEGNLSNLTLAIPRILCGIFLAGYFGGSKFGMPWTDAEQGLALFQVAEWFPEDVAKFGGLFAMFPLFFAWMGAASEAIGGVFLALGLKTRVASFLIVCTMLTAIFFQKWDDGLWSMLPAMGFLWVAMYNLVLGSGKFGLDYIIARVMNNQSSKDSIPKEVMV
ncbi:MAG: DoxX family protein [Saprospiraceae bacterium]|nr:DoxX family protein [Saprospiraceae bacterium]